MAVFNRKKEVRKGTEPAPAQVGGSELRPIQPNVESEPGLEQASQAEARLALEQDQPRVVPDQSGQPPQPPVAALTAAKSENLLRIEHILEEDLGETYQQLDQEHQQIFKAAGETTARQIETLLVQAKVKFQRIFELIKNWLQLIPGINKWFIMQESKIKTDKLMKIKNEK